MQLKGRVFDISRACVDDGPGLRTVVFLKGCLLECPWCHNMEGRSFKPEIAFDSGECIGCMKCRDACPRRWRPDTPDGWRNGCTACGKCAAVCPAGARMIVGKEYGVGELVQELLKDLEFFTCSGGGVTFSGGEPMAQAEFVFACAKELRAKHISVALETSGFWAARFTGKIAGCFDTVLLDLKHAMPDKFKRTVGRDLKIVAENLKGLISNGAEMEIRLTLVPGFNDTVQDLAGIARFLKSCGYRKAVRLQSFHRMAKAKEALLCKKYPYGDSMPVSAGRMAEAAEFLGRAGIEVA